MKKQPLFSFSIKVPATAISSWQAWMMHNLPWLTIIFMGLLSVACFIWFYQTGLGLAYNDARSHLDIGRRVVEGLKPGLAQIGSVWLPLPHLLMVPTIWNDFMWHSGLSGAIQSMVSFVATGLLIIAFLRRLQVGLGGQLVALFVFSFNLNVLYLQSTAMTELLLIATMTAGSYELLCWHQTEDIKYLVRAAIWIMLATLIRYDGWFLCMYSLGLVGLHTWMKKGYKSAEGTVLFFATLAGVGIVLWFLWNWLIFKDPLYFALGPYSAHAQQEQIEAAGMLATKGNPLLSLLAYFYASAYNVGAMTLLLGLIGGVVLWLDRRLPLSTRIATTTLAVPFVFNVLALFLGHSVLFLPDFLGETWFNVRYGVLVLPAVAIGVGYLVNRFKSSRWVIIAVVVITTLASFTSADAVTIDDATVGSSQKNVSEVSGWLRQHAADEKGFILISAASHDAIIFSSGLPMKRFIHEGTGKYWESGTTSPDRWARWIVMRTNDENDQTFKLVNQTGVLYKYDRVESFPFADIYQLKPEYLDIVQTEPVLGKQK